MTTLKFSFVFLLLSVVAQATLQVREGFNWEPLKKLAIQDRGRVKPMDTFARESAQYLTGGQKYKSFSAIEMIFSQLFSGADWENEPFIKISYQPLKTHMGLEVAKSFFSPKEIRENAALRDLISQGSQKESQKEKLNELDKKAIQVQNQLGLFQAIATGQAFRIFPNAEAADGEWMTPGVFKSAKTLSIFQSMYQDYTHQKVAQWNEDATNFLKEVSAQVPQIYPSESTLKREIHYNELRPFRWAWVLYFIAFILLVIYQNFNNRILYSISLATLFAGLLMHVYGFVLRCLIAGRPPVSNMYESVIWVSFGCMLFALFIWLAYRNLLILTSASVFAWVSLVLADNLPSILDPGIHPLEPVLRSNFWLTIHVLTITLSYAAFALSLCLGNVVLGFYIFKPKQVSKIQTLALYMYRAVQIGVVLLAAGTILGGVWADYSWGRFWGWDPKEVWALIALLLYLAVLHGRFSGWLHGFGFVAGTVFSFLGVLMAWYGVNFVLGAGLHSYGFGSGGLIYMVAFLLVQVAFVLLAYYKKSAK